MSMKVLDTCPGIKDYTPLRLGYCLLDAHVIHSLSEAINFRPRPLDFRLRDSVYRTIQKNSGFG